MIDPHALGVMRPAWLALLALALLPWILAPRRSSAWPRLAGLAHDRPSSILHVALRGAASLAFVALALAAAGLLRRNEAIERISRGAHIVLVVDRSGSMNNTFAGSVPGGGEESKASAAKRLLLDFVARREHDRIGVVAFSTSPMFVLPLTDRREALHAAIDAIDLPGLAYTDVARGLAMGLSMFGDDELASRAVVLVSDGAAVVDRRVQQRLRSMVAARPVRLYWLFLRSAQDRGLTDPPRSAESDTPQELPERHLNLFFQSLGVSYRAFEATDAAEVARAIDAIDRSETAPLRYSEPVAHRDLSGPMLAIAGVAMLLLALAKLAEVRIGDGTPSDHGSRR